MATRDLTKRFVEQRADIKVRRGTSKWHHPLVVILSPPPYPPAATYWWHRFRSTPWASHLSQQP